MKAFTPLESRFTSKFPIYRRESVKDHSLTGFTFVELLLVSAIILIMAGIGVVNLQSFKAQTDLDGQTQAIISALRKAQGQAIGSTSLSPAGVYFQNNSYTIFKGQTYPPADPTNEVFIIPNGIEVFSINVGGGNSVLFQRIDGHSDNAGTVSLRIVTSPSVTRTIRIDPSGNVSLDGTITLSGSRVSDSRHLHFDLGWSIQNSTTLNLTFSNPPNPNQTQAVTMAPYFNPDKSVFDWSGSITVGGQNQVLRVHTHNLTATSSVFCIHRDVRFNTKALSVDIDGKSIVSYQANGQANVGLYGGTMTAQ